MTFKNTWWWYCGSRFIRAREHYKAINATLNAYRDQLTKQNKKPAEDLKYRVLRKAASKISDIYSKAWDTSQEAYGWTRC